MSTVKVNTIQDVSGTAFANVEAKYIVSSVLGTGFSNMLVVEATDAVYAWPTTNSVYARKIKVTIIGGGGGGGGTSTTAGQTGGGGASGALCLAFLDYVAANNTLNITVGAAGAAGAVNGAGGTGGTSSVVYNGATDQSTGGVGGPAGSAVAAASAGGTATGGALNITGFKGNPSGTMAATTNVTVIGGNTPLGYGAGGQSPATAAGQAGQAGQGFGSGGSGGRNGTGVTGLAGGAGAIGVVIIEY